MKTIEERAREYAPDAFMPDEILPAREGHLVNLERRGYIAGASEEHKLLTEWHNPKEKPRAGAELLLKIRMPVDEGDIITYAVGDYIRNEFIMPNTYAGAKVLGWREIHE